MKTMTVTQVRSRLPRLADEIDRNPSTAVTVTRRGKPIMALVSSEVYESLLETIEVMADPKALAALRRSRRQSAQGATVPWSEAKARLGLDEKPARRRPSPRSR